MAAEEINDSLIIAEAALLECRMLLGGDAQQRGVDFQRLTPLLKDFHDAAPVIATQRVSYGAILALIKAWLRAPIMEEDKEGKRKVAPNRQETPPFGFAQGLRQGGVICKRSPALPFGLPAARLSYSARFAFNGEHLSQSSGSSNQ